MPDNCISVVIIDDHALFRKGIQQLVSAYSDINVVAEVSNGSDGIEAVLKHQPDIALIDLHMKGVDGISVVRALKAAGSPSRLVMLTVSDSELDVMEALNAGASGYLLKDMEPEELCSMLRQVSAGDMVLSEGAERLMPRLSVPDADLADAAGTPLTAREQEILELLSRGASNKLVARTLGIAESTVKVHVKHVLQKLNLRSRFEAAVWVRNLQSRYE